MYPQLRAGDDEDDLDPEDIMPTEEQLPSSTKRGRARRSTKCGLKLQPVFRWGCCHADQPHTKLSAKRQGIFASECTPVRVELA